MLQQLPERENTLPKKVLTKSGAAQDKLKNLDKYHAKYFGQPCRGGGWTVYIYIHVYDVKKTFSHTSRDLDDAILRSVEDANTFVCQNASDIMLRYIAKGLHLPLGDQD